jgi:hypothetical protein
MSTMKNNPNVAGSGQQEMTGQNQSQNNMGGAQMGTCGAARRVTDIEPHMQVISSCGCNMGKVDHMEGDAIKLTKNDSPDGQHHFIPTSWVARVDGHVHLNKDAKETQQQWKSEASGCGCGS